MKKISIIMPTYGGKYIKEALDSVFNQTVRPYEICITVDGSKKTHKKLKRYLRKKDKKGIIVRVKNRKSNLGIGATLNDCLLMVKGDLIAWLSDDDEFLPDKLELQLKEYAKVKDKNVILYGDYNLKDKKTGKMIGYVRGIDFKDISEEKEEVMKSCFVNFCTTLIPKKVFNRVGLFDPDKRFGEDYEWLMRAIVINDVFVQYIDTVLTNYGVDKNEQATAREADKIQANDEDSRNKIRNMLKL